MRTNPYAGLLALAFMTVLAGPAAAGDVDFKSETFPLERNLAFELAAPGAVRADVQVSGRDLREELRFELGSDDHGLISGGIYAPPGESRVVSVVAFDERGEAIYKGESVVDIDGEMTPEFDLPLGGKELKEPIEARFGSRLLTAGIVGGDEELLKMQLTLTDPFGKQVEYSPEDLMWDLPEGFPEIKYSCFNGAACIFEWKPTLEQQAIYVCLKLKPRPCFDHKPYDFRGPYKFVAVGRQHTCAITKDDDIRCWGDNFWGQLGAPTTTICGLNACSLVPVAVVCPAGEVCKFRSLAAGGDHTCAIDTNGKAWCWGEDGTLATGQSSLGMLPKHTHRQIPATTNGGASVSFVAIDTDWGHSCALSAAQDLFCWGDNNFGQLGWPVSIIINTPQATMIANGTKYKSIATGMAHSCAVQVNGLLDCWGDNSQFQLTGNVNSAKFITVNSKIPLLNGRTVVRVAAGASSTCAENSDNNTICWGKPARSAPASSRNQGFVALFASSATSLATEMDDCAGYQNCTQNCLTDSSGELMCRNWVSSATPPGQLSAMKKPWTDYGVDYTQADVGPNHACAVTSERDIWCWGMNDVGQFGTGVFSNIDTWEPKKATNR